MKSSQPNLQSAFSRGFVIGYVLGKLDADKIMDTALFMRTVNKGLAKAYEPPLNIEERPIILNYLARMMVKTKLEQP